MWAGEGRGALGGVVGAGHDDGSGASDGGEGGWIGTCRDVGDVGCATDDDGGMGMGVASGDTWGRGMIDAKGANGHGRGLGGWAERR